MGQVPNNSTFGCNLCHQNGGGSPCNSFGLQGGFDWQTLAGLDPDGDGYPSGVELGDPQGTWQVGDPDPDYSASHPGLADSTPCGNGTLEGEEVCDQDEFGGASCQDEGFSFGALVCADDCASWDSSGCNNDQPVCGDEILDEGEQCDGSNLAEASCESLGYESGTLACDAVTCQFDTGDCQEGPPETCGNGIVDPDEDCDGFELGGATCQSLGFTSGSLACARTLCRYDRSGCYSIQPDDCGNGVLDSGEDCDGADLGDASCASLGYQGGTLACDETCQLVFSGCLDGCGNGLVEAGEECDQAVPEGITCASLGRSYGILACSPDCLLDVEQCGPLEEGDNRQSCACGSRASRHGTIFLIGFLLLAAGRRRTTG